MPDLPAGTVTFLFTDVEGSTALWERDRAAMDAAVARHLDILRAAAAAEGGVHFKTVGDAIQAAFPVARNALAAALAAQHSLQDEPWPDPPGPLRVRMALHAGEAHPRDGDYLAAPLNRLARLLATGHGGQVLLTLTVQQLVRDDLPAGVSLRPLGEHRLRDLQEPEAVYQAVAPGLPDTFPPLRSLPSHPTNLTAPPTRLIGREGETAAALRLLEDGVRLVTLTGPGGMGKTRLALEIAAEALERFPDGVFFVDLAPVRDPAQVVATIARELGVREVPGEAPVQPLGRAIAERQMLLLLDNCEQVLEAAPDLATLLTACPRLALVATSREPLRLRAERVFPVPPLPLPEGERPPALDELAGNPAVALFTERATASDPRFVLSAENAAAVAAICRRLEGLPLAIELAAARVRLLPPNTLLTRLERALPLLTGGARDAPARQRTLRDAIAWSHDLLAADEQCLFARLGVFVGGWNWEAAEAVANPDGDLNTLGGLASLVDKSLVRQFEHLGEPRFSMLETVREFGGDRLEASGEADAVRRRHAEHFAAAGASAERELWWLSLISANDRLEPELGNLRAAMRWADEQGDATSGLVLATTFAMLIFLRGQLAEGRAWLERLLAHDTEAPIRSRALAVALLGWIALFQGNPDAAERHAARAVTLAATEPDLLSSALNLMGCALWDQGYLTEARQRLDEALATARNLPNANDATPTILGNIGVFESSQGNRAAARAAHEAEQEARRGAGPSFLDAIVLGNLADLAREDGDTGRAAALLREALNVAHSLRTPFVVGGELEGVAPLALAADQPRAAARLLGAADALRLRSGVPVEPQNRDDYQALFNEVRAHLEAADFAQAWAEGQALSLDDAIAEADQLLAELAE